jgi:hypothetical protein
MFIDKFLFVVVEFSEYRKNRSLKSLRKNALRDVLGVFGANEQTQSVRFEHLSDQQIIDVVDDLRKKIGKQNVGTVFPQAFE